MNIKKLSRKEREQLYIKKMTELQLHRENPIDSDWDFSDWSDEQLENGLEDTIGQLKIGFDDIKIKATKSGSGIEKVYSFFTKYGKSIFIIILLFFSILTLLDARGVILPMWLPNFRINLNRDLLSNLLQGLVTLMAIVSSLVIASVSFKSELRVSLWQNKFADCFRFLFLIIVLDLLLLVLPQELLALVGRINHLFSTFALIVLALNILGIFKIIKVTQDYIDHSI